MKESSAFFVMNFLSFDDFKDGEWATRSQKFRFLELVEGIVVKVLWLILIGT